MKTIYRILEPGEITAIGDDYFSSSCDQWLPCNAGLTISDSMARTPHRRRVPASPIIRDARTDPPKESDAVFDGVVACDGLGWYIVRWDSEFFAPKIGAPECYHYWFALPPIPKPEKTEAELAFEEAQKAFASQKYKEAVDWASFSKGYEMGKAAK